MKCAMCEKPAPYRVGGLGYCRAHAAEAWRVQALVIRDMDRSNGEFERWQHGIERGMRTKALRHRTKRQHA